MKIKKVIINNFRAFKHAEIDFDDFNCIIGKNDTGKSTILAALEWFFNPNKELDENDFAAAGFDWYEDATPGYYDVITGETFQGECFKKYIYDDFYISVDIYFNDASIPNNTEESEFIFGKDYLSKDGDICIRKWMCHPYKDLYCPYVEKQVGYRVNKHYFEKVGKMLSDCTFDELMSLYKYNGIGKNADELCKNIHQFEKECKGEKRGLAFSAMKAKIRTEQVIIKEQICSELHNYYDSIGEKICDEQWMDFDNIDQIESRLGLAFPKYVLYTSKTPIKDYLNLLLTPNNASNVYKSIEEAKVCLTNKLSDYLCLDGTNEKLGIKKDEKIDLFTQNSLLFKNTDLPLLIPLKNRGEGLQLKIKNAVFRLLTELQSNNQNNTILAFEEPETHLHPSAQIEMYETIKALSEKTNYHVIITTHSPYIVKELAKDKILPIVVIRDEENNVSIISKFEETVLSHDDYVSMNEINYIAFEEPSVEYHQELFAFLQGGKQTVDQVDNLFKKEYDWFQVDNKGKLVIKDGSPIEKKHSLPYCVRNQIDHPTVDDTNDKKKHNAYLNNSHFNEKELIRKSIEIMRNAIIDTMKSC